VFNSSELKEAIDSGEIYLPDPVPFLHDKEMPYFIVGDDAFALRTWMMKLHVNDETVFQTQSNI
jgi:hypothetical protein